MASIDTFFYILVRNNRWGLVSKRSIISHQREGLTGGRRTYGVLLLEARLENGVDGADEESRGRSVGMDVSVSCRPEDSQPAS